MSLVFQPKGDRFNIFRCLLLESSVPATLSFTLKNLMVLNFWCWILSTAFTEESFLLRARQNSMLYLSKENEVRLSILQIRFLLMILDL